MRLTTLRAAALGVALLIPTVGVLAQDTPPAPETPVEEPNPSGEQPEPTAEELDKGRAIPWKSMPTSISSARFLTASAPNMSIPRTSRS